MSKEQYIKEANSIKTLVELHGFLKKYENRLYAGDSKGNCNQLDGPISIVSLKSPKYKETICMYNKNVEDTVIYSVNWAVKITGGSVLLYGLYHYVWKNPDKIAKLGALKNLWDIFKSLYHWHNHKDSVSEDNLPINTTIFENMIEYHQIDSTELSLTFLSQNADKEGFIPDIFNTSCPTHYEGNMHVKTRLINHQFFDKNTGQEFFLCQFLDVVTANLKHISDYNLLINRIGIKITLRRDHCTKDESLIDSTYILNTITYKPEYFYLCYNDDTKPIYEESFGYFVSSNPNCNLHGKKISELPVEGSEPEFLCRHNVNSLFYEHWQGEDRVLSSKEAFKLITKHPEIRIVESTKHGENYCNDKEFATGWFIDFNNNGQGSYLVDYFLCQTPISKIEETGCVLQEDFR